jgi:hypothetical protein
MKTLIFFILCVSLPVMAHEEVDEHTCRAPRDSGPLTSSMEREIFHAELSIYEKCMFTYVREQQKLAEVHESAARTAIDEWNNYIESRTR